MTNGKIGEKKVPVKRGGGKRSMGKRKVETPHAKKFLQHRDDR